MRLHGVQLRDAGRVVVVVVVVGTSKYSAQIRTLCTVNFATITKTHVASLHFRAQAW